MAKVTNLTEYEGGVVDGEGDDADLPPRRPSPLHHRGDRRVQHRRIIASAAGPSRAPAQVSISPLLFVLPKILPQGYLLFIYFIHNIC